MTILIIPQPIVYYYEIVLKAVGEEKTYVEVPVYGLSCDINSLCSNAGLPTGKYKIELYAISDGYQCDPEYFEYNYTATNYINRLNIVGVCRPVVGDRVSDNLDKIGTAAASYVITSKSWWCDTPGHIQQMPGYAVFEEGLEN